MPYLQEIFVSDETPNKPDRPRVQCLLVDDVEDIPKILAVANAALRVSGQR